MTGDKATEMAVQYGVDGSRAQEQATAADGAYERFQAALVPSQNVDALPDPEPLIDGVFDRDTVAYLYGPAGSKKSFVALHASGCIGRGMGFGGHPVKAPPVATVLYVYAEGVRGIKKRVKAWERRYGPMTGVTFLPVPVKLLDEAELEAFKRMCREMRPTMIVIDTQARTTPGVSENDNGAMSKFVDSVDEIRRAAGGTCVLIVHHTGRDGKNLRGASSMDGAADTIIKVTANNDGTVTLTAEKEKDSPVFLPITFQAEQESGSLVLAETSHETFSGLGSRGVILTCLTETSHVDPLPVSRIVELAGVPRSTTYRVMNSLINEGLVINLGTEKRPLYKLTQGQERLL
ncbi:AAA family ATPase [Streptomyces sp. RK75]|uniref:AAA family ATPase n=1 Tax=Streptomyces sp. RK75 TaxID=2824895 RepID=UPI001B3861EE|nr:AAA family ATPase [Streptomyces sp. RK75]MBQ0863382.1 AAA family ATPase [Streptomyces sp. RK75]